MFLAETKRNEMKPTREFPSIMNEICICVFLAMT